jgi:hypothetical protein
MSLLQAEHGRTETGEPAEPPTDDLKGIPADPIISIEKDDQATEQVKCTLSPGYFVDTYCFLDDPNRAGSDWFPFKLWPAQLRAIELVHKNDKIIVLKARQLGITWLMIAYALWMMIFKPGSMILLFSKTGDDARELMRRLTGMWQLLPEWLKVPATKELEQQLLLTNGSRGKSFKTTKHSGRSFTASFVLIDEAAFIPFLSDLLNAAEATADAGGKLSVISTNDKEKPNNGFADLYKRSREGVSDYKNAFIPWYSRPSRTQEWYEHKVRTIKQDDLWQEYPEIEDQALVGRSSTKRFHSEWIAAATREANELTPAGRKALPRIPGIVYWEQVQLRRPYLIVLDPAEGDATSDPSALSIWDALLWEEVGYLQGAYEPSTLASYAFRLGQAFNDATICSERNNHGHAVLLALREIYHYRWIYKSPFDKKLGWLTTARTKTLAIDKLAELMEMGEFGIRSKIMLAQLANIEAGTQAAPEGDHDDAAMCAIIAAGALTWTSIVKRQNRRRRVASMSM